MQSYDFNNMSPICAVGLFNEIESKMHVMTTECDADSAIIDCELYELMVNCVLTVREQLRSLVYEGSILPPLDSVRFVDGWDDEDIK